MSHQSQQEKDTPEIISINKTRITFNENKLCHILKDCSEEDDCIVISVVGASKSGKSFLANLIYKYLCSNRGKDWTEDGIDTNLEGFVWNAYPEDGWPKKEGTGVRALQISEALFDDMVENSSSKLRLILLDIDLKEVLPHFRKLYALLTAICTSISSLTIFLGKNEGNSKGHSYGEEIDLELLKLVLSNTQSLESNELCDIVIANNCYQMNCKSGDKVPQPGANKSASTSMIKFHNFLTESFNVSELLLPNFRDQERQARFQGELKFMKTEEITSVMEKLVPFARLKSRSISDSLELIRQMVGNISEIMENGTTNRTKCSFPGLAPQINQTSSSSGEGEVKQLRMKTESAAQDSNNRTFSRSPIPIPENKSSECVNSVPGGKVPLTIEKRQIQVSDNFTGSTTPSEDQLNLLVNQCCVEYKKLFSKSLFYFLLAPTRFEYIEVLQKHLLNVYFGKLDLPIRQSGESLLKKFVSKYMLELNPVISVFDKSQMIIKNEFDGSVCIDGSQIPTLISRAKEFAAKRIVWKGNKHREEFFEECWIAVEKVYYTRNEMICQYEVSRKQHLFEIVYNLYQCELGKFNFNQKISRQEIDKKNDEIQTSCLNILTLLLGDNRSTELMEAHLKKKMSELYSAKFPNLSTTKSSSLMKSSAPLPPTSYEKTSQQQGTSKSNTLHSLNPNAATFTPKSNVSHKTTPIPHDAGSILVIHYNSCEEITLQLTLPPRPDKSNTPILSRKIPAVIAFFGDEIVIGHEAKKQTNQVNVQLSSIQNVTNALEISGRDEILRFEEALGLYFAKCKQILEEELGEVITRCLIVIPVMSSLVSRQVIFDSAFLAEFQQVELVSEPSAAAWCYYHNLHGYNNKQQNGARSTAIEQNIMVTYFSSDKSTQFVIYTLASKKPFVHMESVSGTLFLPLLPVSWPVIGPTEHQNYYNDALEGAKLKSLKNGIKIIKAGDSASITNRKLQIQNFQEIPKELKVNAESWVALGAASIGMFIVRNGGARTDSIIQECLPHQVSLRITPASEPISHRTRSAASSYEAALFVRNTPLPATITRVIPVTRHTHFINFELVDFYSDSTCLGKYKILIDDNSEGKWDTIQCIFSINLNGILNVSATLLNRRSNPVSSREVIVERTDSLNLIRQSDHDKCKQNIQRWLNFSVEKGKKLDVKQQLTQYIEKFQRILSESGGGGEKDSINSSIYNAIVTTESFLRENSYIEILQNQLLIFEELEKRISHSKK